LNNKEIKSESGAPRGVRCIITLIGKRNAGKSSLINAILGQEVSIVSDIPGTTTDPVAKPYELLPFGPVTFYDTAGIDDEGDIGEKRIKATKKVLNRSDLVLVVCDEKGLGDQEKNIITNLKEIAIACFIVFNKSDIAKPKEADIDFCLQNKIPMGVVSAHTGDGIAALRIKIIEAIPQEMKDEPALVSDLIKKGDTVMLIVPIDIGAPKGRIILPQVQVLREILDSEALAVTLKETSIESAFGIISRPPALVITDSQVILKVSQSIPQEIPLTTFSTLFARYKGDIYAQIDGARKIDELKDGSKVLISEACSHHVQADDIGRVKIPKWLKEYTGKSLIFNITAGYDFPEDLNEYSLVIHCGGCMFNRAEIMRRIRECTRNGVPVTNYGIAISKVQGVLDRIVKPFFK